MKPLCVINDKPKFKCLARQLFTFGRKQELHPATQGTAVARDLEVEDRTAEEFTLTAELFFG
jgi:hypothetical protein